MWLCIYLFAVLSQAIPVYPIGSIYRKASHFWPLDSITGIKDVVYNRKASIYGNEGVSLKGKGSGFLELDTGKAALNLGEYSDICLVESKHCKNGMTITFWIRIQEAASNGKAIDIMSIKGGNPVDIVRVTLINNKNAFIKYFGSLGNRNFHTTANITLGIWIHSSLVLTKSGRVSLFLNGQEIAIVQSKVLLSNDSSDGKASVMLGQWITLHEIGKTYGPVIHYDEIAIFYDELTIPFIRKIILKNFGHVVLQKQCVSNGTSLIVQWQPPFDTYEHLIGYTIIASSSSYLRTITASRLAKEASFIGLDSNTVYKIEAVAVTSLGFPFNSTSTIHCTTNLKEDLKEERGGLVVTGIDVDKIRIIWTIPRDLKESPIAYGISYGSDGSPAVYKVIYERNSLNYTVTNLRPNTKYHVSVTVYTEESGKFIEEKQFATTKRIINLPTSPIRNLSVDDINWNTANLSWLPPYDYNEPTIVYKILCTAQNCDRVFETSQTSIQLDNLREDAHYDCSVYVGARDIGYFEKRVHIKFHTIIRFPTPTYIDITKLHWNMANISWHPVESSENIVYQIAFYAETDLAPTRFVQTTHSYATLENLQQDMGYFFTVRSGNGTTFGKRISMKRFFVTPDRNECLDGTHSCLVHEICMNKKRSYECHCIQGYSRSGESCMPMMRNQPRCRKEVSRNIEWSETQHGQTAHGICPKGTNGIAHRFCLKINRTSARWMDADLSDCLSLWLSQISYELRSKEKNSSELMELLKTEYRKQERVVGGDVRNMVTVMADIIDMTEASKSRTSEGELINIAENLVSLTDDLLSTNATWIDLPKEKQAKSAGGILRNVESMAKVYSSSLFSSSNKKTTLLIATKNAVMEVKRLSGKSSYHFESESTGSSISIPQSVARSNDAVYYGAFSKIENFLGTEMEHTLRDNKPLSYDNRMSNVVAATLFPQSPSHFNLPIIITYRLPKSNQSEAPHCVFWNFLSTNTGGHWSTKGCQLHSNNDTHVVCHCFHLTNFAVLMSVTKAPLEMKQTHEDTISLITKICIGVSLVALVISFVTFCSIRFMNAERSATHKNLTVALFFAQLLFLFGIDKTSNLLVCRVIAIGLHYLFLVAFTLMGMEGFILYTMLIKVYKRNNGIGFKRLLFACWILPMVIVGVTAVVDLKAYANQKHCWINHTDGFIWSFVGPVIFVIIFNSVILGLAINIMNKKSKKRDSLNEEIWYWIKCLSMLVTILGLTWIFGIFYIDQNSIAVAYVFSIVNASQGLAIFIFLCVLDQRIQEVYYNILCCSTRGHYNPSRTRSGTVTRSSIPSRQTKEPRRISKISMEDQEIMVEFSDDRIDQV